MRGEHVDDKAYKDASIAALAKLFADFYKALVAEGVPVAPATAMTNAYITAIVMDMKEENPPAGK